MKKPPSLADIARHVAADDKPMSDAERKFRESLEARKGSQFTDEEWREARRNLIEFFAIAADWAANPLPPKPEKPVPEPVAVSAKEAARLLSVKPIHIYRLHHTGVLNGFRVHPRSHLKFLMSEIREVAQKMSDERRDA